MKKIPGRTNIFELATKELTLDAMIGWFLLCSNSGNKRYATMGIDFINTFIFDKDVEDAELILCELQYNRMDVFAIVIRGNVFHPVIFEDKVNTSLHAGDTVSKGQLVTYCKRVYDYVELEKRILESKNNERNNTSRSEFLQECTETYFVKNPDYKWGEIIYIYFKIGFIHSADTVEYCAQRDSLMKLSKYQTSFIFPNIRTISDLHTFLSRHNARMTDDLLFKDYYSYITSRYKYEQQAIQHWNTIGQLRDACLSTYPGQNMFFVNAFGNGVITTPRIAYGGKEFLEHEIDMRHYFDKQKAISEKKRIRYIFAFKFLTEKDYNEKIPVLSFLQYRDDKNNKSIESDRIEEFKKISKRTKEIITQMRSMPKHKIFAEANMIELLPLNEDGKAKDSMEIFRIRFRDEISSEQIAAFIKEFKDKIVQLS
jgi:hypothetical protein